MWAILEYRNVETEPGGRSIDLAYLMISKWKYPAVQRVLDLPTDNRENLYIPQEILHLPRNKVTMDILDFRSNSYLVVVDCY